MLPSNYSLRAAIGIPWSVSHIMLFSYSKPSNVFPSENPKSFPLTKRPYITWPWLPLWFHYLPLCTLLTSLQACYSLSTQSILRLRLWLTQLSCRRFFPQMVSCLTPFFHSNLCSNVTCSREAFSDSLMLIVTSLTSSISLPLPSSIGVTELLSLTHIQLYTIMFTYFCIDCIPHCKVGE